MYQDLLIDEDQGWLCRWFQCHGRPTEMKTQKLLTWSYDDGFPIIRENSLIFVFYKALSILAVAEKMPPVSRGLVTLGGTRGLLESGGTTFLKPADWNFQDWATGKLPWLPFLSCWRRKRNKQNHFKYKLRCFLIFLSKGAHDISSGHSTNKMPSSFTTFSIHICSRNFPVNSFNIQHFSPCNRLSSRQLLSVPVVNSDWLKTKCWVFKSKSQN